MNYEELKDKILEKKQPIVVGVCFVLVFIIGFGTGRYERQQNREALKSQTNYTTNKVEIQTTQKPADTKQKAENPEPQVPAKVLGTQTKNQTTDCPIKGNISSAGKKIYHIKGGAYYNIVKPEECFQTESEALAAGFVRSSR